MDKGFDPKNEDLCSSLRSVKTLAEVIVGGKWNLECIVEEGYDELQSQSQLQEGELSAVSLTSLLNVPLERTDTATLEELLIEHEWRGGTIWGEWWAR